MAEAGASKEVEHVVIFKHTDEIHIPASDVEAWAEGLRSLRRLDGVLQLHVGTITSCEPNPGAWTHALYARYTDKAALQAYTAYPDHIKAVSRGNHIFPQVMALDWEFSGHDSSDPPPYRIALVQWKPQVSAQDIESLTSGLAQSQSLISFGPNFSPARARGFHYGFATFGGNSDENHDHIRTVISSQHVEKFFLLHFNVLEGPCAKL